MSTRACSAARLIWSRSSGASVLAARAKRRSARRAMAPTRSRSLSSSSLGEAVCGGSFSISRRVFRNSSGSASRRARRPEAPSRQASQSRPTSRVLSLWRAIAAQRVSHASRLARAMGSRCFMAAWAPISPLRTHSWTAGGRCSTRPRRPETQLGLRSNRRARASRSSPKPCCSSARSQPCSRAVSASARRSERSRIRAPTSFIAHTVAVTVSPRRRRSARTRLYPSITTKRPGSLAATTTIGTCWPRWASELSSRRSCSGRRTRSPS